MASPKETHLPLFEDRQHAISSTAALPPASATPAQVHGFLVYILTSRGGFSVEDAQRIAVRWTLGTGHELRSYPPLMYLDTFGRQEGWLIYREVKLCIHHEKNKSILYRYRSQITFLVSLIWELVMLALARDLASDRVYHGDAMISGVSFGIVLGAPALLLSLVWLCVEMSQSVETAIEKELSACMQPGAAKHD